MMETRPFLLCGAVLFVAAWGMHRIGSRLVLIRVLGGVASPALALAVGLHSFHVMFQYQPYSPTIVFLYLPEFFLCGFLYGVLLLPRHFKAAAVPRLHIHWAVLALFVPLVPSLILRAATPGLQGPISSLGSPKAPHYGEVIFARWTPSGDPLTVEPFDMHLPPEHDNPRPGYLNLSEEEIQRLHSSDITGHVKILGSTFTINTGRLVIVMSQQVDAPFQFFLPAEGAQVIYLQTSDSWRKLPPEAGESRCQVRMYVPQGKPHVTGYAQDCGDGPPGSDETRYLWEQ
jgi:hypothetical protein